VPSKGLEPPHPCEYMDLNHARLPIPPRWQSLVNSDLRDRYSGKNNSLYSTGVSLAAQISWLHRFQRSTSV
jgi:hypothetical protein